MIPADVAAADRQGWSLSAGSAVGSAASAFSLAAPLSSGTAGRADSLLERGSAVSTASATAAAQAAPGRGRLSLVRGMFSGGSRPAPPAPSLSSTAASPSRAAVPPAALQLAVPAPEAEPRGALLHSIRDRARQRRYPEPAVAQADFSATSAATAPRPTDLVHARADSRWAVTASRAAPSPSAPAAPPAAPPAAISLAAAAAAAEEVAELQRQLLSATRQRDAYAKHVKDLEAQLAEAKTEDAAEARRASAVFSGDKASIGALSDDALEEHLRSLRGVLGTLEEERQTRDTCIVCFAARRAVVLLPCAHFCMCGGCAASLTSTSAGRGAGARAGTQCPVCRAAVTQQVTVHK